MAADYYTFSRAGVTHFVGKGESEFTSLEQWEREYRLFGQLHAIPFFAKYRKWKGFSVWKKSVRRDKSGSVRGRCSVGGDGILLAAPSPGQPCRTTSARVVRVLGAMHWDVHAHSRTRTSRQP